MTDNVTKRDLKRDVETLKNQSDPSPTVAFRTDDGRYFDKDGNPITDFSDVVFVIPPEVWKQWEDFSINVTED